MKKLFIFAAALIVAISANAQITFNERGKMMIGTNKPITIVTPPLWCVSSVKATTAATSAFRVKIENYSPLR